MNIEEKVKTNLLVRGFDNKTLLNNRGLIGATIDETILEVVKNLRITDVSGQSELLKDFVEFYNKRQNKDKWLCYDEIDIYLESL